MGLLGAYVSISGGVEKSFARGEELGCDAIQIFSKSQRQWKAVPLSDASVEAFQEAFQNSQIRRIVIHDSYLINLASPEPEVLEKSREAFIDEMVRAEKLGVSCLVFHPGSHMRTSEEEGIERIAESLNCVMDKNQDCSVQLLLETTAGQGDYIGYRFEQLAEIISLTERKERLGVCYDTSHTFAAGYDIRTQGMYDETFKRFDEIIGLERLEVFHLNDSKSNLGSKIDRHENIGDGLLGAEPFRVLVNDPRFKKHPMILETPGGEREYKKNISLLRSFMH